MTLSDIFSAVSSSAVIVTLIFLVLQMRQTNRNQQALMQQGRTARWIELGLRGTEPVLSETLSRAMKFDMTLDAGQVHAASAYGASVLWAIEDSFLQHRAGLLSEESWMTELSTLRANLAMPFVRVAWLARGGHVSGAYRDYVNGLIHEIAPIKPFDEAAAWKTLMAQEQAKVQQARLTPSIPGGPT